MTLRDTTDRYGSISIGLHWLTLALLIAVYATINLRVLSASGKSIPFFGIQLPALLAPDKLLAGQLKEIHETIGMVGYYLIGAHALAALFHHFIKRDNTLTRILPRWR